MKILKTAFFAVCIFLLLSAAALCEGFFVSGSEIVFAEVCPDGYQEITDKLILGEGEIRIISNEAEYFSSDKLDVVSIDEYGVFQALAPGKTVISVYIAENNRKDMVVEVKEAPKSIKLNEKKGTLTIGDTYQLKATITKSTVSSISWFSSAPNVVDVDDHGLLTALSVGECIITARTHNGLTAECTVTVKLPPPAEIDLFTDEITLYPGESVSVLYALNGGYNETITWSTGDKNIAAVDQSGVVTAVNIGRTVICMEASGGDVRFVDIIVPEGSTGVSFPSTEISLYVGGKTIFEPEITGGSGKYEYVSMDPSIASIDVETGEICALRTGSVYILAVTPNYAFGEFLLNIVEGPEELILSPERYEIAIGESVFSMNNLDGFDPMFTWYESSNHDIAHVDEYGVITGRGEGVAVISVHSGGLAGKAEITVLPPAKDIDASAERSILGAGESVKITYTLSGGTGTVEYASRDMQVAQIDPETGTLYALNPGECEITLTVSSGVKTSFPITVFPAPDSVYIEKSHYTLAAGNRHFFFFGANEGAVTTFEITSSDPALVWYEGGSLICGQKTGTASVTVRTHNGHTAVCGVTVTEAPAEIVINAKKLTQNPDFDYYILLPADAAHALNAFVSSVPDIEITYSASHPNIANVNEQGLVTTHKAGTSLITVSLASGLQKKILVSVQ